MQVQGVLTSQSARAQALMTDYKHKIHVLSQLLLQQKVRVQHAFKEKTGGISHFTRHSLTPAEVQ
jgi:hypothetical protein